jgi:uncharacterized protein YaaN involved in tellurite resistance
MENKNTTPTPTSGSIITADTTGSQSTAVVKAVAPRELTTIQLADINTHAEEAVANLVAARADIFSEAADKVTNVGLNDQKTISSNIQLMQEQMNSVFYSKEKTAVTTNMSKDITELQNALAKINPSDIKKESRYKIIKILPFGIGNYIVNVLKQSAEQAMTLQQFVDHLEASLKQGDVNLRQDNAQLKVIYDDLKAKQVVVSSNAFLAETIAEKLEERIKAEQDVSLKNNLTGILARVQSRAQNIRATENVIQQFFVSIIMTRNNNDYLLDAAREMETNGVMVVNVAVALRAALVNSKNALDMLTAAGTFTGKLLTENASMINGMVTQMGDVRKNPIIPMKMMEDAIALLKDSIDKTNKLNVEVIESAKTNSAKIKASTEDLKNTMGQAQSIEVKSIDASGVLKLTEKGKE